MIDGATRFGAFPAHFILPLDTAPASPPPARVSHVFTRRLERKLLFAALMLNSSSRLASTFPVGLLSFVSRSSLVDFGQMMAAGVLGADSRLGLFFLLIQRYLVRRPDRRRAVKG